LTSERLLVLLLLLLSVGCFSYPTLTIPMIDAFAQKLSNATAVDTMKHLGENTEPSVCTPTQTSVGDNLERNATTSIRITMASGSANPMTGNVTTTSAIIGGDTDQSTLEITDHIREACIALQIGDSEGALFFLNLALSGLGNSRGSDVQGSNTPPQLK